MTVAPLADTGAPEAKPVFVYVLGHDGSNVVKIGKADDVASRIADIQRMSPVKLHLLTQFDGGYKLEAALHRRFKHFRTHSEWFDFGDLDAVAEIAEGVAEIEAEQQARRERELERLRMLEQRPLRWGPAIIGGRTLVYPTLLGTFPEGARCVAQVKTGRRCAAALEDGQITNPNFQWRVPGHGLINCDVYGSGNEVEEARWLAQRCRRHAGESSPAFCEPEWELFDPEKHAELLRPDLPVAPGLTDPLDAVDGA
jgi:Meiotically up-regulated gene 113